MGSQRVRHDRKTEHTDPPLEQVCSQGAFCSCKKILSEPSLGVLDKAGSQKVQDTQPQKQINHQKYKLLPCFPDLGANYLFFLSLRATHCVNSSGCTKPGSVPPRPYSYPLLVTGRKNWASHAAIVRKP